MGIDFNRHKKKVEIERLKRVSYMNNTKWRELFQTFENNPKITCEVVGAKIKVLSWENILPFKLFGNYHYADYIEGAHAPICFTEIEWIFIPANCEFERWNRNEKLQSEFIKNNIFSLKKLIDSLGLLEYDFDENGLKIYGYK